MELRDFLVSEEELGDFELRFTGFHWYIIYIYIYLVGGFNPSEKHESQLGLFIISNLWKNIKMFRTTNQFWLHTLMALNSCKWAYNDLSP